MPVWPSQMPSPADDDLSLSGPQNAVIRTSMSVGPAKTRPRVTAAPRAVNLTYLPVSAATLAVFEAFVETDLSMGALEFDMAHPVTGVTRQFRLLDPEFSVEKVGEDAFKVSVSLELLP